MSTLTVTNINTGANDTPLNIATGGTYGGSIKLEAANSNMIIAGNVNMANAMVNGTQVSGFMGAYKNKVINGNFDFWQRGTSNGMSGYYTVDRWASYNTGTTKVASQQAFTVGQTDVPGEPRYFMRHVVTSVAGASNLARAQQAIESVRTLAGKTATLSFWAKADTSKNIAAVISQFFGSGGSPSADVYVGAATCALTSSWQKFTATFSVPSISGKTLGTNVNDALVLAFYFDAGSTYNTTTNSLGQQSGTFDIAQVQLEEGPVATAFEQRHIGQELQLCQRYYEKSYPIDVNPGTDTYSGLCIENGTNDLYQYMDNVVFKVTKRTDPNFTIYGRTGSIGNVYDHTGATNRPITSGAGSSGAYIGLNNSAAAVGNDLHYHWVADADI